MGRQGKEGRPLQGEDKRRRGDKARRGVHNLNADVKGGRAETEGPGSGELSRSFKPFKPE